MPIFVNSPYSGRPVKVRDQDVGRAIRDDEGRIFYAVPRTDGEGYYGSPTRKGSEKDEQRYLDMESKGEVARETGARHSVEEVHDATGTKPRGRPVLLLLILLIVLAAIGGGYYWLVVLGNPIPGMEPAPPEDPGVTPAAMKLIDDEPLGESLLDHAEPRSLKVPAPAADASVLARLNPIGTDGAAEDASSTEPSAAALPLAEAAIPDQPAPPRPFLTTASGLQYRIDEPGTGAAAVAGSFVVIDYTAALPSGQVIDTTEQSGPIGFVLWSGQVIRGWDEGVAGMREGEVRSLIIPPNLVHAMGDSSDSAVFPHTTLHCTIELRDVRPGIAWSLQQPGTPGGRVARPGDTVEMHYTAWVVGRDMPFDSSRDRGEPIVFRVGAGQVITGWDLGVAGMVEGEIRSLEIPSYLAYGKRGFGRIIPPGADLRYQLDLVRVVD